MGFLRTFFDWGRRASLLRMMQSSCRLAFGL